MDVKEAKEIYDLCKKSLEKVNARPDFYGPADIYYQKEQYRFAQQLLKVVSE